jgi:hypothetical protein
MFLSERLDRFIDCLDEEGTRTFKALVERYNVLGNISSNRMAGDLLRLVWIISRFVIPQLSRKAPTN